MQRKKYNVRVHIIAKYLLIIADCNKNSTISAIYSLFLDTNQIKQKKRRIFKTL